MDKIGLKRFFYFQFVSKDNVKDVFRLTLYKSKPNKLLIFNYLQIHFARVRSIFAKRLFLERSKFFFSKSFAVLKNGFIIVMYSKAKQTANKYGEKRIKK